MKEFRISSRKCEDDDKQCIADLDYGTVVEWNGRPCLVVWEFGNVGKGLVSLSDPRHTWDNCGNFRARVLGKLTVTLADFK